MLSQRWHRPALMPASGLRQVHLLSVSKLALRRPIQPCLAVRQPPGVRRATLEAGENKSGHLHTDPNEGLLYFNDVFPPRLQWVMRLPWAPESRLTSFIRRIKSPSFAAADPANIMQKANPEGGPLKIVDVIPRLKEGGAYVKFSYEGSSMEEVEHIVKEYLKTHQIKPWWNPFRRIRANLVRGKPWIEDMYRLPTSRLRVEFLPAAPGEGAAELTQEQLYSFFRPYGKLADIVPQPSDSKIVPRFALIDFAQNRRASMAKNCLHGYKIGEAEGGGKLGTIFRITYESKVKPNWIKDWLFSHPRIVIPALAALATAITIAVFDPIRTFFVKAHITRTFHLTDNRVYRWFKAQATDLFHRRVDDDEGMQAIWEDRKGNIDQIQTWLMETADTFIVVQGPRGSGKKELVLDQALKNTKNKLIIDCKPIQEARGDSGTIDAIAQQVGYRPVFSWMNSISGLIDLAAQGTTGVKTGFSETLDSQMSKILNNTATALKQIAVESRKKDDKDANLSDDEWIEAHPEKRPVVVIDNFLHKSQESSTVYDKLAEWAARLTTANIAHVIFLTNDVSFSKSLGKALPDRVFRQMSLSDCSPEVAKRYVISHLDADDTSKDEGDEKKLTPSQRRTDLAELDSCISSLGGRLTDLEFLARRIKSGETPSKAVQEIIAQSASEILKMYLFGTDNDTTSTTSSRRWSPEQAWLLIKQLAHNESLRYNAVLLNDSFKGQAGEATLQALEQAELITIVSANGRPQSIKPGKPVYQPAFRMLTEDHVLKSRLDLAMLGAAIKGENETIDKCEGELRVLAELPKQPKELTPRVQYLLGKIMTSQEKIEKMEAEQGKLKKVLQEEF